MNPRINNASLYRSILVYGAIGVFLTSVLVALVSILPLYLRLTGSMEDRVLIAANTKAEAAYSVLHDYREVANQIASRSAIRDELVAYTNGRVSFDELVQFNLPKLTDALQQSKSVASIYQFDTAGNQVLQIGLALPGGPASLSKFQTSQGLDTSLHAVVVNDSLYLLAASEITTPDLITVGTDIVAFRADNLVNLASDLKHIGESALLVAGLDSPSGFEPLIHSRPLSDEDRDFYRQVIASEKPTPGPVLIKGSRSNRLAIENISGTEWYLIIQVNEQDLYGEIFQQVLRIGALSLLLTASGVGGLMLILRPLTRNLLIHEKELERLVAERADQYQVEYEERLAIEQDLRSANARFQSVVQNARDAIILTDSNGKIKEWNPAAEELFGYTAAEITGNSILSIIPNRVKKSHKVLLEKVFSNPAANLALDRGQWPVKRKDGSEFPGDITLSTFQLEGQHYFAAIIRDLTEIRTIEKELEQSQERYRSMIEDVVDASSIAICITDADLKIVWENLSGIRLWGLDRESVIGRDKRDLLKRNLLPQIDNNKEIGRKILKSYAAGRHLENLEIHFPPRRGHPDRWVLYTSKPIRVGFYSGGRIEQYTDITDQKRLQFQIEEMAMTDELTGIYNRRGLTEFARRDITRAQRMLSPLSAIFIDIDRFKDFNDRYGHAFGDKVLKELAGHVHSQIRDMDLFARFGGEEFIILLPEINLHEAGQIAQRIHSHIANTPFIGENGETHVTVSMGVVQLEAYDNLASLLARADMAMYRAKESGRNRIEIG